MKCPYCSNEMEIGYIEQTDLLRPLEWTPQKHESGFFVSRKNNIKLTASLKGGTVTTHYCTCCRKFIIDQNTLEI